MVSKFVLLHHKLQNYQILHYEKHHKLHHLMELNETVRLYCRW